MSSPDPQGSAATPMRCPDCGSDVVPHLCGWTDTFDDGWRAALVALCDARKSRRTRRWAYRAFVYLRQRHADQDWPKGRRLDGR